MCADYPASRGTDQVTANVSPPVTPAITMRLRDSLAHPQGFHCAADSWTRFLDAQDFQKRVEGIRGHHLAKAGVEMALWDLLGKRAGKSLKEMFGGTRDKVEVGVSIGIQESAVGSGANR